MYSNAIPLLSIGTINSATNGSGINLGEYISGVPVVHVQTLSGSGARLYPSFAISATATGPGSGRYVSLKSFATSLRATGLAILTLPNLGRWCRLQLTIGGTSAASKLGGWIVAKGQS